MKYFGSSSLGAQNEVLKRRLRPTASVLGEGQASPTAAASANDPDDNDDDCHLEVFVGLDKVECFGAKLRARRKVRKTVIEVF